MIRKRGEENVFFFETRNMSHDIKEEPNENNP